jgi:hypothetical protein
MAGNGTPSGRPAQEEAEIDRRYRLHGWYGLLLAALGLLALAASAHFLL